MLKKCNFSNEITFMLLTKFYSRFAECLSAQEMKLNLDFLQVHTVVLTVPHIIVILVMY